MRGHLLQKEIQWDFTPPASSHIDGVWERQIRTVRKVLNAILKEQTLDDELLSALFCEVATIINGRPLTTVSDDPNDECPPDSKLSAAASRECRIAPPPPVLLKAVISMASAGGMYSIWLTNFRRGGFASAYLRRSGCRPKRNVKCGDLRLIADENTPSKRWPLERIIKTFPGKDGLVRSAQVKTSWSVLTRSVDKLCLLKAVAG